METETRTPDEIAREEAEQEKEMALLDSFAIQILNGMLSRGDDPSEFAHKAIARDAYSMAEAMIEERSIYLP